MRLYRRQDDEYAQRHPPFSFRTPCPIDKNEGADRLDECPWSCETQCGGEDGSSLSGDAAAQAQRRWENGIVGDGGTAEAEAAFKQSIEDKAAEKARITEACVPKCKAKAKPRTPEYKKCMTSCQMKELIDEAKEN